MKITDNNKVPQRPRTKSGPVLGKRPTPIQRRLRAKLRAYSTLSVARSDESLSQTALSDSEDESIGKSKQLLDVSKIMEKYFNNNDQLTYVMEKMVSDLTAKVVEERQKNANRACGEVTSSSGNETLPGHFVEQTLAGINTTLEQDTVLDTRFGLKRESKKMIKRVEQETSDLSLQLNKLLTKATQKKMELERLESIYRNTESKMALLIASLSVIEEKKKKIYARRDSMEEKSNKIAAYQGTLEYMLKREAVLTVESKKRSLAISQKKSSTQTL